jgi:hypothetical protein
VSATFDGLHGADVVRGVRIQEGLSQIQKRREGVPDRVGIQRDARWKPNQTVVGRQKE